MHFFPIKRCYMMLQCHLYTILIGYENDILNSNLHVKGAKFGGKQDKFGRKSSKKLNSADFMEFVFSKSVCHMSRFTCHVSPIFYIYFFLQIGKASQWSGVINRAYPVQFQLLFSYNLAGRLLCNYWFPAHRHKTDDWPMMSPAKDV